MAKTLPFCTAAIWSQPSRAATVSRLSPQHFESARKIRSGLASMIVSALSCGYPLASSTASAMLRSPNSS